jgi:dihydrolipoamide dehydrogenase
LVIAFKRAIIAAGSQAVRLPFMPNYPRVVDSTGALALKEVPKRMLIIGGDVVGQPMLAHKAVHEAHVAAEVIAGELLGNKELAAAAFNARVIPSVAYTDPEVAWVGLTEDQAKAQGIKVKKGLFPWAASGRAIANGRDEGVTKLLFDDSPEAHGHGKILGGGMVGTHAGDMIGEIALAIEMGADAVDIGKTIHPHPTLGESIGMAAEIAHGSCTDVPPARK